MRISCRKKLPETLAAKFAWHYELGGDILTSCRSMTGTSHCTCLTMLGSDGLVRLIDACRDRPLDECVAQCLDGLRSWSKSVPFNDDISLLAAEIL